MIFNLSLFNPIKSMNYLSEYFTTISQVQLNIKLKRQIWIFNSIMVMRGVQAVFFYLAPLKYWTRILLIDNAVYFSLPILINLMFVPVLWMIVMLIQLLFFENNNIVTDVIKEVVVKQDNRYFLYEFVHNRRVSDLVRKYSWITLMVNQPLLIISGIFFLF